MTSHAAPPPLVATTPRFQSRRAAMAPALAAALLGIVLVAGAGFVPLPALHNAAHDARHAAGFPCH